MQLKSKRKLENIMSLLELQQAHDNAIGKADGILAAAERQKRQLTNSEQSAIDNALREATALKPQIAAAKSTTTRSTAEVRALLGIQRPRLTHREPSGGTGLEPIIPKKLSREYFEQFYSRLSGGGPLSAAMYEGTNSGGGYAVPIMVDDQVVPLAPTDSAIRRLATVIPTKSDIKTPQVTARATVAAKSETSAFTVAVPTFGQYTLSAFAAGVEVQTSLEFTQDVTQFNTFVLEDAVSAFTEYESSLFVSGTGIGQAQGISGNVGAGVTEEPDANSNLVSIQGTLDILGKLKEKYHDNATWLMQRATSLIIRKAQIGANLFEPVFRRENRVDLLHGYPVSYEATMPSAARGNSPIVFGDFKRGYIIGDRGGSALFLKVLGQAAASQGLVDLLFYRRTDGRVRVAEALQSYTIAAS
jgi:HK97 family phage major capsid protein